MLIVEATRQGGLGVDLCPSMLVKDRFAVRPHVMLNTCLSLSWPDNSFRPRSRVARRRQEDREVKLRTLAVVRMYWEPLA